MKKLMLLTIIALTIISVPSCTENARAKNYGGTMTVDLPKNKKLVNATWKDTQLWYLYRDRRDDEKPEMSWFKEKSSFGIAEGVIVFKEE